MGAWLAATAALFGLVLSACGSSEEQAKVEPAVTYHRDIRPVLEQSCTGCHKEGGIAPFVLASYADALEQQGALVPAVTGRTMPPWQASDDCHPLEGDRRLSEEDIELFTTWQELDFPEGDEATFEARPALPGVTPPATEADLVIEMAEPYAAPSNDTDTYQCFLLPYTFEKDTYLTAIDVRPDQNRVVHHVQIHTFPPSSQALAAQADAADPGPGYPCAGGTVAGATNIYSWRPGATAVQMQSGDAMLVTAGTGVVIQVHYNIQGLTAGEAPPPDRSSIAFWTLPEGQAPERVILRRGLVSGIGLGAPLAIPAGESQVVSSQDWPVGILNLVGGVPLPAEIVGQTPHMHAIGTRLSSTLKRDGTEQCLIDIPRWSFEWQQDYLFPPDAAVPLLASDVLTVTCEYDNSPANQPIVQGTQMVPRDVGWGEGTYDEMCLNYAWMRFDRVAYEAALAGTPAP